MNETKVKKLPLKGTLKPRKSGMDATAKRRFRLSERINVMAQEAAFSMHPSLGEREAYYKFCIEAVIEAVEGLKSIPAKNTNLDELKKALFGYLPFTVGQMEEIRIASEKKSEMCLEYISPSAYIETAIREKLLTLQGKK